MNLVLFALNTVILLSLVFDLRTTEADRRISFGILRIVLILPLLVGAYLLAYAYIERGTVAETYNSENVFALVWMTLAYRLYKVTSAKVKEVIPLRWLFGAASAAVLCVAVYGYFEKSTAANVNDGLVFPYYGIVYCSALFLLGAVLLMAWRLEGFWRSLGSGERWRYKYLVLGLFLTCFMIGWSSSYRLAFLRMPRDHFLLLAVILAMAWMGMIYAIAKHRLLNRKIFISRKVVYASITPMAFSGFFILVGVMALLIRLFGWSAPFVMQWLVIMSGVLAIIVLAMSGDIRKRVKYFVSTNFYVNKYEYRDEWLAFSDLLQGKLSKKEIVDALYQILRDSLYTRQILIWLGDIQRGFRLIPVGDARDVEKDRMISGDDPIVCYLHNSPYLYSQEGDDDPLRGSILNERKAFLEACDIVLMVPLILGGQCVGLIGLGPETTGGRYGHDDFDLLAALSSHAASALLAVKNAEELAMAREESVWNNLSAFVLHDIKNAATMLDLLRKNAPQHMNNPEFQQDMLESMDDALKRMAKVQARLSVSKGQTAPYIKTVDIGLQLKSCIERFTKKLPGLSISLECPPVLWIETDSDFICQIMENVLINAWEAGGDGTVVRITVAVDSMIRIDLSDNGPGIRADLLQDTLFEPFKSGKSNGSGIGLWQVRQLMESLGGDIQAENAEDGGACFTLTLPYRDAKQKTVNNISETPSN